MHSRINGITVSVNSIPAKRAEIVANEISVKSAGQTPSEEEVLELCQDFGNRVPRVSALIQTCSCAFPVETLSVEPVKF